MKGNTAEPLNNIWRYQINSNTAEPLNNILWYKMKGNTAERTLKLV